MTGVMVHCGAAPPPIAPAVMGVSVLGVTGVMLCGGSETLCGDTGVSEFGDTGVRELGDTGDSVFPDWVTGVMVHCGAAPPPIPPVPPAPKVIGVRVPGVGWENVPGVTGVIVWGVIGVSVPGVGWGNVPGVIGVSVCGVTGEAVFGVWVTGVMVHCGAAPPPIAPIPPAPKVIGVSVPGVGSVSAGGQQRMR